MSMKWKPPDLDDLIKRYRSGQSVKSLAEHYGVTRQSVTYYVRGLPDYRGLGAANRLMSASRTPEQRVAYAAAANRARRGQVDSLETRIRRAETRQRDLSYMNETEVRLAALLDARGLRDVVLQQAIGPYNCDIAAHPVAVEVQGGHWHAHGAHRDRFPDRARYILNEGWLLVLAWVTSYEPLRPGLADYIVALVEEARADPSLRGQYRVVWGGGDDCTRPGLELDQLTAVPPYDRRNRRGA